MNTNNITMTSVIQNIWNQATIGTMVFGSFSPFYQHSNPKKYAYGVSTELAPQIGLTVPYYGSVTLGLNFEFLAASVPTKVQDVRFKKEITDKMSYLGTIGSFEGSEFKIEEIKKDASEYFGSKTPELSSESVIADFTREFNSTAYTDLDEYKKFAEDFNTAYAGTADSYHLLFAATENDYEKYFADINDNKLGPADRILLNQTKRNKSWFVNRTGTNKMLKDIKFRPMKIDVTKTSEVTTKDEYTGYISDLDSIVTAIGRIEAKIGAVDSSSPGAVGDIAMPDLPTELRDRMAKVSGYKTAIETLAAKYDDSSVTADDITNFKSEYPKSATHNTVSKITTYKNAEDTAKASLFKSGSTEHSKDKYTYAASEIDDADLDEKAKAVLKNAVTEYFDTKGKTDKVEIKAKTEKFSDSNITTWGNTLSSLTTTDKFPDATIKYWNTNDVKFKTGLSTPALTGSLYELKDVDVNRITLLANFYRGFTVNVYTNVTGSRHINGFGFHGFFSLHQRLKGTFVENWSTYNLWSSQQVERKTTKIDFATAKELSNTIEDSGFKSKFYEVASADSSAGNSVKPLDPADYKDIPATVLSQSWTEVQNISLNSHKLAFSVFPSVLNGDSLRVQFTLPAINAASDAKLIKVGFVKTLLGNPLADDFVTLSVTEEVEFTDTVEIV